MKGSLVVQNLNLFIRFLEPSLGFFSALFRSLPTDVTQSQPRLWPLDHDSFSWYRDSKRARGTRDGKLEKAGFQRRKESSARLDRLSEGVCACANRPWSPDWPKLMPFELHFLEMFWVHQRKQFVNVIGAFLCTNLVFSHTTKERCLCWAGILEGKEEPQRRLRPCYRLASRKTWVRGEKKRLFYAPGSAENEESRRMYSSVTY